MKDFKEIIEGDSGYKIELLAGGEWIVTDANGTELARERTKADAVKVKKDLEKNESSSNIKDFKEILEENKPILEGEMVEHLTEEERKQAEEIYIKLAEHIENGGSFNDLDEGIIGGILGGVGGALVGPALGKAVCKALGVEKGIFYDLLTSRLVTAALGATIFGKK